MIRVLAVLAALSLYVLAVPAQAETATPSIGGVDALVAPVALYPDALLMPLLMAASYPDELIEAQAWLAEPQNAVLRGDALVAALVPRPWDPSVKALVPFPEMLGVLAARPDWMARLGAAFVAEPATVMAEVQKLRHAAMEAGKLKASPHLAVRVNGTAVTIAPADPAVLYIPVYDPSVAFGTWQDRAHPPGLIETPSAFRVGPAQTANAIRFSIGFSVLTPLWGWAHPDWAKSTVSIDVAAYERIGRYGPHVAAATWHHEAPSNGYFHFAAAQLVQPVAPLRRAHGRIVAAWSPARHGMRAGRYGRRRGAHLVRFVTRNSNSRAGRVVPAAHAASWHRVKLRMASAGRGGRYRR